MVLPLARHPQARPVAISSGVIRSARHKRKLCSPCEAEGCEGGQAANNSRQAGVHQTCAGKAQHLQLLHARQKVAPS